MKEAATMLRGEARRAASILHQTPGWRWRRALCLTERTQQCQSGPTIKGWFHDRCNRVDRDACRRGSVGGVRDTVRARAESSARAAWKGKARAGGTARTRSTREWTALFQRTWQTTELERQGTCGQHRLGTGMAASERVRVAPPGSDTWNECG